MYWFRQLIVLHVHLSVHVRSVWIDFPGSAVEHHAAILNRQPFKTGRLAPYEKAAQRLELNGFF